LDHPISRWGRTRTRWTTPSTVPKGHRSLVALMIVRIRRGSLDGGNRTHHGLATFATLPCKSVQYTLVGSIATPHALPAPSTIVSG
jgi:hypothetical protein